MSVGGEAEIRADLGGREPVMVVGGMRIVLAWRRACREGGLLLRTAAEHQDLNRSWASPGLARPPDGRFAGIGKRMGVAFERGKIAVIDGVDDPRRLKQAAWGCAAVAIERGLPA